MWSILRILRFVFSFFYYKLFDILPFFTRLTRDHFPISDECKMKPKPLNPGQTVFYMVQPRFMNVDIRVMVDVTQGALDLFLSPRDDSFVVTLNSSTGYQDVRFNIFSLSCYFSFFYYFVPLSIF